MTSAAALASLSDRETSPPREAVSVRPSRRAMLAGGLGWAGAAVGGIVLPTELIADTHLRAGEPCRTGCDSVPPEYWLVNARCIEDRCPRPGRIGRLRVSKWTGRWEASSVAGLAAATDPSRLTLFVLHGNRFTHEDALEFGFGVGKAVTRMCPGVPPLRVVIWSWPSEQELLLPERDLQLKAERSDVQGFLLAEVIRTLPLAAPVRAVGFSYGARMMFTAYHLLAGGVLRGQVLPPEDFSVGAVTAARRNSPIVAGPVAAESDAIAPEAALSKHLGSGLSMTALRSTGPQLSAEASPGTEVAPPTEVPATAAEIDPPPPKAATEPIASQQEPVAVPKRSLGGYALAGALPGEWLVPGATLGNALAVMDDTVVFVNRNDPILSRLARLFDGAPITAIGSRGVRFRLPSGVREVVTEVDVTVEIGSKHTTAPYLASRRVMGTIAARLAAALPTVAD